MNEIEVKTLIGDLVLQIANLQKELTALKQEKKNEDKSKRT